MSNFAPIIEVIQQHAKLHPERRAVTFLVDGETTEDVLTYGALQFAATEVGRCLRAALPPAARVVLLLPPGLEFIEAFLGCCESGMTAVPSAIEPRLNERARARLSAIIRDCRPSLVITATDLVPSIEAAMPELTDQPELPQVTDLSTLLQANTDAPQADPDRTAHASAVTGDTIAFLQYTSGSTGTPKGVVVTHRNLLHNECMIQRAFGSGEQTVAVSWLPLFHDMGLIGSLLNPLFCGGHTVLLSPASFLQKPLRWLQAIARYRADVSGGPNFGYDYCVDRVRPEQLAGLDLSCWQVAFNGAEPIHAGTLQRFVKHLAPTGFPKEALFPCYGLAENTLLVSAAGRGEGAVTLTVDRDRLASGQAVPAMDESTGQILVASGSTTSGIGIAIVDPQSHTRRPDGSVGEIWTTGDSRANGYWQRDEASQETFAAQIAGEAEPWLRTGDLGFLHAGKLFVTGRLKDVIIIRGSNHYPHDLERTVAATDERLQPSGGAAFSIDIDDEEQLVVVQELRREARRISAEAADELILSIRRNVAAEHGIEPFGVVLLAPLSLPKTTSGKVQRRECRSRYLDDDLRAVFAWRRPADLTTTTTAIVQEPPSVRTASAMDRRQLRKWIVSAIGTRLGTPDLRIPDTAPLSDYALDSKSAIALSGELEEVLGRPLPVTLLYDHPTLGNLLDALTDEDEDHATGANNAPSAIPIDRSDEPIAIVGLGCRFPKADDPAAYWQLLMEGCNAVTTASAERWEPEAVAGLEFPPYGGFLDDLTGFDPAAFGIAPREAARMDPQQRLLLEVVWQALGDAGIPLESLPGTPTGVFMGLSNDDFGRMQVDRPELIDPYAATGSAVSIAANRISYLLDLQGPSLAIDTACSSSLVAVHLACQALRSGECETALAGGVNVLLSPTVTANFAAGQFMAADGRCKVFDAAADGYVRGEGAGAIVLKRVSAAERDGDMIYAVIAGSAVNQDGRSNGLTAPNPRSQRAVLEEAYRRAGVSPGDVSYVEAHGTGTFLGDPIELKSLGHVLADQRSADRPCLVGSVKTNIGHLEAAAGIAGLIKTALSLHHGKIPAQLNFETPNPHIPFDELPLSVCTVAADWPSAPEANIAGVSSFGFGGTNAHVVLRGVTQPAVPEPQVQGEFLVPLSAHSEEALEQLSGDVVTHLESATDSTAFPGLASIASAAAFRRSHRRHRIAVVADDVAEWQAELRRFGSGMVSPNVALGVSPDEPAPIVFVFTGQGGKWSPLDNDFLVRESVFTEALMQCDAAIERRTGWSVINMLISESGIETIQSSTEIAQPCLFALQVALARHWQSWGLVPWAVVGHSVGEVAAAHVAGALDLEAAAELIVWRGTAMQREWGQGRMAALGIGADRWHAIANGTGEHVVIAADNSPHSITVSGPVSEVEKLARRVEEHRIFCRVLQGEVAFHSARMDSCRDDLLRRCESLRPESGEVPYYSTVTASRLDGQDLDAAYWGRNARDPVRFRETLEALLQDGAGCLVEIGPQPVLARAIEETASAAGKPVQVIESLRYGEPPRRHLLRQLGKLYVNGFDVNWRRLAPAKAPAVKLPTIGWRKEPFWLPTEEYRSSGTLWSPPGTTGSPASGSINPDWFYELDWPAEDPHAHKSLVRETNLSLSATTVTANHAARLGTLSRFEPLRKLLESISAEYARRALRQLGAGASATWSQLEAQVLPQHQRLMARLRQMLVQEGRVVETSSSSGELWNRPVVTFDVESLLAEYPECSAELTLLTRCGEKLAEVLTGAQDPIELLFPGGSAELVQRLYQDSPHAAAFNELLRDTLGSLVESAVDDRALRILEIGAGTGGTTAHLLPLLPADRVEYVFTDISAAFLGQARQRFAAYPFIEYRTLDLEAAPRDQGFDAKQFDVIIAANVIHATADLGVSLEHARSLLADGGTLLLLEITEQQRWLDLVFGLTDGWWRFRDIDTRPDHALLTRDRWRDAFAETGYSDIQTLPVDRDDLTQTVLVARAGTDGSRVTTDAPWMVVGETDSGACAVVDDLVGNGCTAVSISHADGPPAKTGNDGRAFDLFDAAHWQTLFDEWEQQSDQKLAGLVYLWPEQSDDFESILRHATAVSTIVGQLARRTWNVRPRVWIVTRSATAVTADDRLDPFAAVATGIGRVLAAEHVDLFGRLIDLPHESTPDELRRILRTELANSDRETQVAWRDGVRHTARLAQVSEMRPQRMKLAADATYVIAGGLGGLGVELAKRAIAAGARRLVLIGRTELPPRKSWRDIDADSPAGHRIAAIRELEADGASIHPVSLDLGDADAIRAWLADYEAEAWPEIRGVFYAAAVLDNRALMNLDGDAWRNVLAAKLVGAWEFHRWLADRPHDLFVLFSSAAGLFGSPGQANYAGANTFLDALAGMRRSLGLPAVSLQWGPWAESGWVSRSDRTAHLALTGVRNLTLDDGMAALTAGMADARAELAVLDVDWPAFRRANRAALTLPLFSGIDAAIAADGDLDDAETSFDLDAFQTLNPQQQSERLRKALCERVAGLLGMTADRLDEHQSLSLLGLDSLMAVELRNWIERRVQVEVPVVTLLEGPSVVQLTDRILELRGTDTSAGLTPLTAAAEPAREFLLSDNQQALWVLHELLPANTGVNCPAAVGIRGALDIGAMRSAFEQLLHRHAALRSTIHSTAEGPVQRIHDELPLPFQVVDASGWTTEERQRRITRDADRSFDFSQGPLLRVVIYRIADDEHVLLMAIDHIVVDFWSLTVLCDELGELYTAARAGRTAQLAVPELQFSDYVNWLSRLVESDQGQASWDYWREQLSGDPPVLELRTDRPRPAVQSFNSRTARIPLDAELSAQLRDLAERSGTTLYTLLLATYQLLLCREAGQSEVIVGSVISGRDQPGLSHVVGYVINPVALRADISGNPSFLGLADQVKKTVLGAMRHQDFPLVQLARRLNIPRDPSRSPIFQTMFVLQKAQSFGESGLAAYALGQAGVPVQLGDLDAESVTVNRNVGQFDLTLMMADVDHALHGAWFYNSDLFDEQTVRRFAEHFETLCRALVNEPEQGVFDLPLVSRQSRENLLELACGETATASTENIVATIADRVTASPKALAVDDGDTALTYGELAEQSDRLARLLVDRGAGPESCVGICHGRTADWVVATLAVLKSGAAYLPLDQSYPTERLRYMIETAGARLVIVDAAGREQLQDLDDVSLIDVSVDVSADDVADQSGFVPPKVSPQSAAYVIFTSGSTGRPKGVVVPHEGLANLIDWHVRRYDVSPADRTTLVAGLSFDASVWELWPALCGGASLHLPPAETVLDGPQLAAWMAEREITLSFLPTPLAEAMLTHGLDTVTSLRTILTGGDQLRRRPPAGATYQLVNHYGPTENTVVATAGAVAVEDAERLQLPTIGRPIDGVQAYILDAALNLVPSGVPGELYLAGESLARGYVGQPGLTADRFVPDPFRQEPGGRMYRTGDRVCWNAQGEIEFLGRIDQQVKIRGYRIELGEIEQTLSRLPEVDQAVVIPVVGGAGQKHLIGYVTGADAATPDGETVREQLRDALPSYMVPTTVIVLDRIPLTPNGKVDRSALPRPEAHLLAAAYEAPATETERMVADVWQNVLGIERAGRHDHFFDLGGDSLLATQVVVRLREKISVELPLRDVFEDLTVAGVARAIDAQTQNRTDDGDAPTPVSREQSLVLSSAQQRLWFLDRLLPGTPLYNIPMAVRLTGPLDVGRLTAALNEVVRRHEILRTVFRSQDGSPAQVVLPELSVEIPVTDLSTRSKEQGEADFRELVKANAETSFALDRGPLLRAELISFADDDHALLVAMHHIIADGWSVGILISELGAGYEAALQDAECPMPPPRLQYADYAAWERGRLDGQELARQTDYWKDRLRDVPPLELPTDRPRPRVQSHHGAYTGWDLSSELTERLKDVSRRHKATLFETALASFEVVLRQWTGQHDLAVGTPMAGRSRPEWESLIGLFVNTVVLRNELDDAGTFANLVAQVHQTAVAAQDHQDVPFDRVVEAVGPGRDTSRSPLFQVMFVLQNTPFPNITFSSGLQAVPVEPELRSAKVDLTLFMWDRDGTLSCGWEYNTDLFDRGTIDRLSEQLTRVLTTIATRPEIPLAEIPLMSSAEERQVIAAETDGASPDHATSVLDVFQTNAVERHAEPAVIDQHGAVTFGEVNRTAAALAGRLRAHLSGPEPVVAICLPRSRHLVTAMLSAWKAGGCYLPLDPSLPDERLQHILYESGCQVVLTDESASGRFASSSCAVIDVDDVADSPAADDVDTMHTDTMHTDTMHTDAANVDGDQAAYVLYTSGSTGRPKGVVISHAALSHHMQWMLNEFAWADDDLVLQKTSISFDASVWEFWAPLMSGRPLVMASVEAAADPRRLLDDVIAHKITMLQTVPTLLQVLVDEPRFADCRTLRRLFCGGEPLPASLVQKIREKLDDVEIINLYGPTEVTIDSVRAVAGQAIGTGTIPIGRPVPGLSAYVLDDLLRRVPCGTPGELYLAGPQLARGYAQAPSLTAERFVPDPFGESPGGRIYRTGDRVRRLSDGRLEFLDRVDDQIKLRGFRIELGEIEARLRGLPDVASAAVAVIGDTPATQTLGAALVMRPDATFDAEVVRSALASCLPDYMVPGRFVSVAALPQSNSGKLDRRKLAGLFSASLDGLRTLVAPRNERETELHAIWSELLGTQELGVRDNFFEVGGHSLLAIQVLSRIESRFGVELPLLRLFEHPTIEGLAKVISEAELGGAGTATPIEPVEPRPEIIPLSFAQQRLWFLDQLAPGNPFYNMPTVARLDGPLDVELLEQSLTEVVRRHEVLRSVFQVTDGTPSQVVRDELSVSIPVFDLSMLTEEHREHESQRLLRDEAMQGFDLREGPLLRARVIRLSDTQHILSLVIHHIAADGWSIGVLVRELGVIYESRRQQQSVLLPAPRLQYADFAIHQREQVQDESYPARLEWHRERLAGASDGIDLPTDHPRPKHPSYRGDRQVLTIPAERADRLRQVAGKAQSTLFMTLLTAFNGFLARWTGQDDLVVGAATAGRHRRELEEVIGFFVDTLVFRTRLAEDETFASLLTSTRTQTLDLLNQRDVPFDVLVHELRPDRRSAENPLFNVMFVLQNAPLPSLQLDNLAVTPVMPEFEAVKFDLVLNAVESDGALQLMFGYRTDLFEAETITALAEAFDRFLTEVIAAPETPLSRIGLVSGEAVSSLMKPSGDAVPFVSMSEQVRRQAARRPGHTAVQGSGRSLTFAELDAQADCVASFLQQQGIGAEDRVGLCLERSADFVAAVLGVLRSGAAYVPLDPAHPLARLSGMIDDAGLSYILCHSSLTDRLPSTDVPCETFGAGEIEQLTVATDGQRNETVASPEQLAYIIFTSGSTGRPKGVMLTQAGLSNLVAAQIEQFAISEDSRVLQFAATSFDASVSEIFTSLAAGATLVIPSPETVVTGQAFVEFLREQQVSVATLPPSYLRVLPAAELPKLATLVVAGEACDSDLVETWSGGRLFLNAYGPTENTVCVSIGRPEPGRRPGIGRPISRVGAYVLDSRLQPCAVGMPGELYVSGDSLARGYGNRADLTAATFVPDPFAVQPGSRMYRTGDSVRVRPDGQLDFLGRLDDQVKVRGYRIELGEIESRLAGHADVLEAAATVRTDEQGHSRLIAYFVPQPETEISVSTLRSYLAETLPEYMVPAIILPIDDLPRSVAGKLDRKRLPDPSLDRPELQTEYVAPGNPLEQWLVDVWQDILGLEKVGIHDNFFELGGDSIKGALLINRLQEELGESVYVTALFDAPHVGNLAKYLAEQYATATAVRTGMTAEELAKIAPPKQQQHDEVTEATISRLREILPSLPPRGAEPVTKNRPAVFVLSPPRSGSTLLRVMLGGHPELFAPPELELLGFNTLEDRRRAFSGKFEFWREGTIRAIMQMHGSDAATATRLMEQFEASGQSVREFYGWMQSQVPGRLLIDKTPSYALDPAALQRAEEDFEDVRFVHLLRHPCGMMRSFLDARTDQVFFRQTHSFTTRQLAEMIWDVSHRNILDFLAGIPSHRHCRVSFEEIVGRPENTMRELCSFLEIDFVPAMIDPYAEQAERMTDGIHPLSKMLGDVKFHQHRGISADIADRWKQGEDLRPSAITGELASRFGYDVPVFEADETSETIERIERGAELEMPDSVEDLSDEEVAALLQQFEEENGLHDPT